MSGGDTLASISSALSLFFQPTLHKQWNRVAPLLNSLNATGDVGDGQGKSVNFDVEFSGNTAQTVAEGSDVASSEFNQDPILPVTLPWAHYRSSFQVSETLVAAALGSGGTPEKVRAIFQDRILGAQAKLARQIEQDLFTGTGVDANGNPTIIGMTSALLLSGAYGGINVATYPEFASTILGNGGVLRALTTDLMALADANIFTASNEDWRFMLSDANLQRKYEGLFGPSSPTNTPLVRINDENRMNFGTMSDDRMQPSALTFKGRRYFRDSACPANKLFFCNPDHIQVKYLPPIKTPIDSAYWQIVQANGSNGADLTDVTGIPVRVVALAKTGDSYKISVKVDIQAGFTRPNTMAIIQDLSET